MILYCVRHGETEFNAAGRIQGQLDSELSPLGMRQCAAVADALATRPLEVVYSSPLKRAAESAKIIAQRLRVELRFDARLMEINAGCFQGHCWSEIETKFPDDAKRWRLQDPDFCLPGGESRRMVMQRAGQAFAAIREAGHKQAAVVAHGGSLSGALKYLLDIPAERNPFEFCNASITRLSWGERGFKLLSLNDVAHLHGLAVKGGDL